MLEPPTHDDAGRPLRVIARIPIRIGKPGRALLVLGAEDATGLWSTDEGWQVSLDPENARQDVIDFAREIQFSTVRAERAKLHQHQYLAEVTRIHDLSQDEILRIGRSNRQYGAEWRALRHPIVLRWSTFSNFYQHFTGNHTMSWCIEQPEFVRWFEERDLPIDCGIKSVKKVRHGGEWRRVTVYVFDFPTLTAAMEFRFRWL